MAIESMVATGLLAVIGLLLIFALVQAGLSVFYARALNNQVSQGLNALVGVNNMTAVDRAMEDQKRTRAAERREAQVVNNSTGDSDDDSGN